MPPKHQVSDRFHPRINKKQPQRALKILLTLFSCHQEFLLDTLSWWRPFGLEAELEMGDDAIDDFRLFNKSDDSHLATAARIEERVNFSWEMYFPKGVKDPDYTVLRLLPLFARGWYENFAYEFKLRECK